MSDLSAVKTTILDKLLQSIIENAGFIESQIEQKSKDMSEAPGRMQSRYDSSKQEIGYMVDSLNKRLLRIRQDMFMIERFKRESTENCDASQDEVVGSVGQLEIGREK